MITCGYGACGSHMGPHPLCGRRSWSSMCIFPIMIATVLTAARLRADVDANDFPTWMPKDSQLPAPKLHLPNAGNIAARPNIPTALPITSALPVTTKIYKSHNLTTLDPRRQNHRTREEIRQARPSQTPHKKIRRLFSSFVATLRQQRKSYRRARRQRVLGGLGLLAAVMVLFMAALYHHACFGPIKLPTSRRDSNRTVDGGLTKRRLMQSNPNCQQTPSPHGDEDDQQEHSNEDEEEEEEEEESLDEMLHRLQASMNSAQFNAAHTDEPRGSESNGRRYDDATDSEDDAEGDESRSLGDVAGMLQGIAATVSDSRPTDLSSRNVRQRRRYAQRPAGGAPTTPTLRLITALDFYNPTVSAATKTYLTLLCIITFLSVIIVLLQRSLT